MTVTQQQAQMLASLAVSCRPNRAPTWDEAGVVANIAKVRHRSLAEVALAVIRAAADRECMTPGVIPSAGPHWQEKLAEPKWQPDKTPRHERCGVCSEGRETCARKWSTDHEFEPDVKRPAETDVAAVVEALKAEVAPAPTVAAAKPEVGLPDPRPELTEVRAQLRGDEQPPAQVRGEESASGVADE